MNMNKQIAGIVVAVMCAGTTASARTADFSFSTPNMTFEIDDDASNARFAFPRNTAKDKDFWRLILDDGVRNAEGDFAKMLRNALVYGIRYDAELYVCRRTLDANPACADVIGRCCRKMKEYGEFYFDGRFTVRDTSPLPPGVVRGEFLNKDTNLIKNLKDSFL